MRATEILTERQLLFEMPYLRAGSVDWGLEDQTLNLRRAGVIVHSSPTILRQNQFGTFYRLTRRNGGEFALIAADTGMIVYYMQYETAQRAGLGRCATQVKVWMTIAPGSIGIATEVFFRIMLTDFDSMVSDHIQTDDGRQFWLRRMAEAIQKDMRVGLLDHGTPIEYDSRIGWSSWLAKVDGWGKLPEHHERLFFISTTPFRPSSLTLPEA
jgi:hypothetical protein